MAAVLGQRFWDGACDSLGLVAVASWPLQSKSKCGAQLRVYLHAPLLCQRGQLFPGSFAADFNSCFISQVHQLAIATTAEQTTTKSPQGHTITHVYFSLVYLQVGWGSPAIGCKLAGQRGQLLRVFLLMRPGLPKGVCPCGHGRKLPERQASARNWHTPASSAFRVQNQWSREGYSSQGGHGGWSDYEYLLKGNIICHKRTGFRPTSRPGAGLIFPGAKRCSPTFEQMQRTAVQQEKGKWLQLVRNSVNRVCHKVGILSRRDFYIVRLSS